MRPLFWSYILWALGLIILVADAVVIYFNVMEYFGSGPPYYDRTTNMDKWENPALMLLGLAAFGLAAAFGCWYWGRKLAQGR